MALRLLHRLWNRNRSSAERKRKRAQEQARRREDDREHEKRKNNESDEDFELAVAVLISDEIQRFQQQLQNDLADAIQATRFAYEQAEVAEREAIDILQRVQADAVVLSDSRRVYFRATGELVGEDHQRVTDPSLLDEARDRQWKRPGASTYESYRRASERVDEIGAQKNGLGQVLDRLDDLQQQIDNGDPNPKELIKVREQFDEIVGEMPSSARELYQDLQAAREQETPADHQIGEALDAPRLQSDFERASSRMTQALNRRRDFAEPDENSKPVYKPAPPLE